MVISQAALQQALRNASCHLPVIKTSMGARAGSYGSYWRLGSIPPVGTLPPTFTAGSGYVPTRATVGALGQTNAQSGNAKYVGEQTMGNSFAVTYGYDITLCDRLWACSGLDAIGTGVQTITTPGSLPAGRDPLNGLDVEPWLEYYAAAGTGAATVTLTGVDSTGTAGRTWTYTKTATTPVVGEINPFVPLTAVGGCRQVTSIQNSATFTSGTNPFGITLLRRLCSVALSTTSLTTVSEDAFKTGLPIVYNDACLFIITSTGPPATGVIVGEYKIIEMTP